MSKITEYDAITGNAIERDLTDLEVAQVVADRAESVAQANVLVAKAAARQAVLDKLGLTADEVAALLG
jgi:hypothetical protein